MHYLTVSTVARALELSEDSVRRYVKIGHLRARRTKSGIRLFTARDVEQFADIVLRQVAAPDRIIRCAQPGVHRN